MSEPVVYAVRETPAGEMEVVRLPWVTSATVDLSSLAPMGNGDSLTIISTEQFGED